MDQLSRLYLDRAYHFALNLAQNPHDANELVQEAFVEMFRSLHRYDASFAFSTWFFQIIVHRFQKLQRKRRLLSRVFPFFTKTPVDPDSFADSEDSPELALTRKEEKEILLKAIQKLPEEQRLVVTLYDLEGLPQKEIAEILSIPVGTVMSRLHYARLKLKDLLEPYFKDRL